MPLYLSTGHVKNPRRRPGDAFPRAMPSAQRSDANEAGDAMREDYRRVGQRSAGTWSIVCVGNRQA